MALDQTLRKVGRTLRARFAGVMAEFAAARNARSEGLSDALQQWQGETAGEANLHKRLRRPLIAGLLAAVALAIVFPTWAWWISTVDDSATFGPPVGSVSVNQSRTVASIAALLNREVNQHAWTPNDPFFFPSVLLDNMPNFQRGVTAALGHVATVLKEQSSQAAAAAGADRDLRDAAELLQYPPDVWIWRPALSIWPAASTEEQYGKAIDALAAYNTRLAAGQAAFERNETNLNAVLSRIREDFNAAAVAIDRQVRERSGFFFSYAASDLFYAIKGQMYAHYIVLKGLTEDFQPVISQHGLNTVWDAMMESLQRGAGLHPTVVLNGGPDSQMLPCHLCSEGFYLARTREGLAEISIGLKP